MKRTNLLQKVVIIKYATKGCTVVLNLQLQLGLEYWLLSETEYWLLNEAEYWLLSETVIKQDVT